MSTVQTVMGEISVSQLGKTLIHEHFIFGYPGFQGDVTLGRFDRAEALKKCITIAEGLKEHGVDTVVDPTPNDCGRDPLFLKEISERTGVQIICATGYYYEGEGAPPYFKFRQSLGTAEDDIYDMFRKEIEDGIADTKIKPGVIKLASSRGNITSYERMFFKAAARVQQEIGITIVTHTQEGTMGPEQAELLVELGADPANIIIGHMCGNTDISYHLRTLETGVSIAFDRFGLQGFVGAPLDQERMATVLGLIGIGYEDKIMLAHDTVNVWLGRPPQLSPKAEQALANWKPTYIFETILPMLQKAGVSDEQLRTLFVENPRKAFA
ncbi:phosphotriesterase family protein [Desertibacillus haloalkaliphilus]|uniref:phosphotriesterase family protein n=1 Tax=Desertibacillus haloalkaliphilus TaxID=1328930 RepID=UPI001C273A81|nr:phosphotriesterase-related protein [Desertibacillus haloalkaliphilus]MBU8908046.1 phosphotriesterase-related protein [Desertibacillus haloalkaliphilus]